MEKWSKRCPFTVRITWFEDHEKNNIRLRLEDCEGVVNIYPINKEKAEHIWFMFRNQVAPPPGEKIACVISLIALIKDKGFFLEKNKSISSKVKKNLKD